MYKNEILHPNKYNYITSISILSIISILENEASTYLQVSQVDNRWFLKKLKELLGKNVRCDFLHLLIDWVNFFPIHHIQFANKTQLLLEFRYCGPIHHLEHGFHLNEIHFSRDLFSLLYQIMILLALLAVCWSRVKLLCRIG